MQLQKAMKEHYYGTYAQIFAYHNEGELMLS